MSRDDHQERHRELRYPRREETTYMSEIDRIHYADNSIEGRSVREVREARAALRAAERGESGDPSAYDAVPPDET